MNYKSIDITKYNTELLVNGFGALGITLDETKIGQFICYYELLKEWNEFMNLTAITDYEEVIVKHFVDSVSFVKAFSSVSKGAFLLDIGTGAGFPGIPLKIIFPELKITLLDSLNKRINFLNQVIEDLELNDIEAVHGRAEEYIRQKKCRDSYDYVVSRAVANLSTLSEYCIPYVKVGGSFVSYKSEKASEEVEQAGKVFHILGGGAARLISFELPDSDYSRTLVVIEKRVNSPAKYPRKAGVPAKDPLGV